MVDGEKIFSFRERDDRDQRIGNSSGPHVFSFLLLSSLVSEKF